jgi:tetratricopeptide (TPR) repeat protein
VGLLLVLLGIWYAQPTGRDPFLKWAAGAQGQGRQRFQIIDPDEKGAEGPRSATKVPRRYETFAHRVLDLDAEEAPVAAERYALLDGMIDDVKRRVAFDPIADQKVRRRQAERILQAIDEVFTERNFLYPPEDYDVVSLRSALAPQRYTDKELERILRVGVNKRRASHARAHADGPFYIIDCDISSFIYVGIVEALGVQDLHLVDLPDHMFVRWELGDGSHLNWDTNDAEVVSDKEYASDYRLGKRLRKGRVYLASMTAREAEGFVLFLRATRLEEREGGEALAIADLERARELYPQSTQVRAELAWLYATAAGVSADRRREAVGLAQGAVELEPECGDFWDSLAAAHGANGDFERAVTCARRAEKLAEGEEERAEFRAHRKALERGRVPGAGAR